MGGTKGMRREKSEWLTGMSIGLIIAILFFAKLIM